MEFDMQAAIATATAVLAFGAGWWFGWKQAAVKAQAEVQRLREAYESGPESRRLQTEVRRLEGEVRRLRKANVSVAEYADAIRDDLVAVLKYLEDPIARNRAEPPVVVQDMLAQYATDY